ncbi:MAG: SDR family NAD(P)-dependent oxidoreductase [Candidatus Caldarchaeum sp.]
MMVTGGAGFIGSVLVKHLLENGVRVTVVDDFSTGRWENLPTSPDLKVFVHDVAVRHGLAEFFDKVDAVIHLAAIPSVPACEKNVQRAFEVNVMGLENVLETCVKRGVGKLVFTSSAAVYGDAEGVLREDAETRPFSVYGWTKLIGEEMLRSFSEKHGVEAVALRVFNVYGRNSASGFLGVVDQFIADAASGKPLHIHGDGGQVRDFIHVNDVAKAILLALEKTLKKFETINIGTGQPTSIKNLAEKVLTAFGRRASDIVYEPARRGDIRYSVADISKAHQLLGFSPKTTLDTYLASRAPVR